MKINIVLVEPEIPQNTGNIARTCSVIGATLHLVGPLGFSIEDKYLKRAGLDYWHMLELKYYDTLQQFLSVNGDKKMFFVTTKGCNNYCQISYPDEAYFVFGKETAGLPNDVIQQNFERCIRIPMIKNARSLNLSNSVAIIAYEALRQSGFASFKCKGDD